MKGNANGIGEQRKKELQGSCDALSINAERCVALDNVKLQDNNKIWWEKEDIIPIVKQYVEKWKVDAVSAHARIQCLPSNPASDHHF